MPRLRQFTIAALLGGAALALPTAGASAQGTGVAVDPGAATHTVRKGDTLWDLAATYLGNPRRWTELYRLNLDLVRDPHWIEPGMVLKLRAGVERPSAEPPAAPTAAITDVRVVEPGASTAPATPAVRAANAPSSPATTAFNADASRRGLAATSPRPTAVRSGDHLTAPYLAPLGGPEGTGRLAAVLGTSILASDPANRAIQYRDRVRVALPKGATGLVGEQLLVIGLGDVLGNDAQVVVPVGVVTLTSAAAGGTAEGELTRKFAEMAVGQTVTRLDTLAMPAGVMPVATTFGPVTKVRWIAGASALSAPGQYVILDGGSKDGLVPGDQLSLRDVTNGDVEVAVAQVTRVNALGATAIVQQVRQGGVTVGMRATVNAKMP